MKPIFFFALLLLLGACKTTHRDTQSVTQVQQYDSLAQYSQRQHIQNLTLDQWQEVEWELDSTIPRPTDTLSPVPCPSIPTLLQVKQGKTHKILMRAPHLSLKLKKATQQTSQEEQQTQDQRQEQHQVLQQHHFHKQERETTQQLLWKLFWVVVIGVMVTFIAKSEK